MAERTYDHQELRGLGASLSQWDGYQTTQGRLDLLRKSIGEDHRFLDIRSQINHEGAPKYVAHDVLAELKKVELVSQYMRTFYHELDAQKPDEAKLKQDLEGILDCLKKKGLKGKKKK